MFMHKHRSLDADNINIKGFCEQLNCIEPCYSLSRAVIGSHVEKQYKEKKDEVRTTLTR